MYRFLSWDLGPLHILFLLVTFHCLPYLFCPWSAIYSHEDNILFIVSADSLQYVLGVCNSPNPLFSKCSLDILNIFSACKYNLFLLRILVINLLYCSYVQSRLFWAFLRRIASLLLQGISSVRTVFRITYKRLDIP